MKIFSVEYMDKTAVEEIKNIDGVYFSKSRNSFAVTDQMMEQFIEKYDIITDEELSEDADNYVDYIYTGIEQWIEWNYDGEEVEFFGSGIYIPNYAECVKLDVEDWDTGEFSFEDGIDWADEIHETLMEEVSFGFKIKLEEELNRIVDAGYNLNVLKGAFDGAKSRLDYINEQKNKIN